MRDLETIDKELTELLEKMAEVEDFRPETNSGLKARSDVLVQLRETENKMRVERQVTVVRLEVEEAYRRGGFGPPPEE